MATRGAAIPGRSGLRRGLVWPIALVGVAWAAAALWFAHPAASIGFLGFCAALAWCTHRLGWTPGALLVCAALVLAGWSMAPARSDRVWEADTAEAPWAEFERDLITLHNHRAFDWRTEADFTPRWETRTFRLSQLRHLDFLMAYWGSPHVCHTMVTFDFGADGRVCASIEARRELGESYSALAGMFRRYELVYVMGAEHDLVRLRTHIRPHNEVHLFRLNATPAVAQRMFMDYLRSANTLRERPAWYHSLLTNCSTTIRTHVRRADIPDPWDWRVLANGHADGRLYDFGYVSRELPLPELKRRSLINAGAIAAGRTSDFSNRIRDGRPGF